MNDARRKPRLEPKKRMWKETGPLEDRRSESRRGRERRGKLRNLRRTQHLHGVRGFSRHRRERRLRQHKSNGHHRRPAGVLAARDRARHHAALVVPATHRSLFLRRRLLLVMVFANRAVSAPTAANAMGQQGRCSKRRVQQHHGQRAQPCRPNSRRFFFNPVHAHNYALMPNDIPIDASPPQAFSQEMRPSRRPP